MLLTWQLEEVHWDLAALAQAARATPEEDATLDDILLEMNTLAFGPALIADFLQQMQQMLQVQQMRKMSGGAQGKKKPAQQQ